MPKSKHQAPEITGAFFVFLDKTGKMLLFGMQVTKLQILTKKCLHKIKKCYTVHIKTKQGSKKMTKVNTKELMKKAHAWARNNLKKVGDYKIALMLGMKEMWLQVRELGRFIAKSLTIYTIADWFMKKNADKLNTCHTFALDTFHPEDIVKETEKAYQVQLTMLTISSGAECSFKKIAWIPKSVCTVKTLTINN